MFSRHYLPMYLTVAGLIVLGVVLSVGLWAQQRRQSREQRGRTSPAAEQDRARPSKIVQSAAVTVTIREWRPATISCRSSAAPV